MPPVTNSYSSSYATSSPTPSPSSALTPATTAANSPPTVTYPSMTTIQTNILTVAKGLNVPKPKCKSKSYQMPNPAVPNIFELPGVSTPTQAAYPVASTPAVPPLTASPVMPNSYASFPSPSINPISY